MGPVGDAAASTLVERARGEKLYLDANAVIYALEGEPALRAQILPVLALIDAGEAEAVTSEMTLAEVLVLPYRARDGRLIDQYERLLTPSVRLRRVPVTADLWRTAARLRAETPSLRLPDALHAATAVVAGCTLLVTGDRRLAAASPIPDALIAVLET